MKKVYANPRYELQYNNGAWFRPWIVVEVRIEGVGYKKYSKIASYANNADALSHCNSLNKVEEKPRVYQGSGFYK